MLETYSLTTAMPIDKCFIAEEEILLPRFPYITFHPCDTKGTSRQYSYWSDVIDGLKNSPEFNHEIIQVGGENDDRYDVNTAYLGKTSIHSLAYLIKNSSLHLSYDSFPLHLASHYDIKIVCIFLYRKIKLYFPYFHISNFKFKTLIELKIRISYSSCKFEL